MRRLLLFVLPLVTLPAQEPLDPAAGQKIFESQCAVCHGQNGGGGRGPSLQRPKLERAADDAALGEIISNGIPPEMPGAWQLHPKEVTAVAGFVRSLGKVPPELIPGNAERGEKLYAAKGCGGCHMVAGQGSGFGPELTAIGARRNAAHLRKVLVSPGEALQAGFLFVQARMAGGSTVRGIRMNEDSFTIQIKDAGGRFYSFRKAELAGLRRLEKETPMPSYRGSLSDGELDDLVAYLAARKGKQ